MTVRAQLNLKRATLEEARPGEDVACGSPQGPGMGRSWGWRQEGLRTLCGAGGGAGNGETPYRDYDAFTVCVCVCVCVCARARAQSPSRV